MCKKIFNENSEDIFVTCELAKKFFDYIKKNFLSKNELKNSLVLLRLKRNLAEEDYKILSCYVYCVWQSDLNVVFDEQLCSVQPIPLGTKQKHCSQTTEEV